MPDDKVTLKISVRDTGIGIKKESLNMIFDSLTRVNEKENYNIEGSGLGLSISKHLIERIECKDRSHNSVTAEKIWNVLSKLKEKPIIPFEVETENFNGKEKVTKYVVRDRCNMFEDISIVIRGNKIITAYINDSTDEHFTLNCSKYSKF